jgi:hypothetical protein
VTTKIGGVRHDVPMADDHAFRIGGRTRGVLQVCDIVCAAARVFPAVRQRGIGIRRGQPVHRAQFAREKRLQVTRRQPDRGTGIGDDVLQVLDRLPGAGIAGRNCNHVRIEAAKEAGQKFESRREHDERDPPGRARSGGGSVDTRTAKPCGDGAGLTIQLFKCDMSVAATGTDKRASVPSRIGGRRRAEH